MMCCQPASMRRSVLALLLVFSAACGPIAPPSPPPTPVSLKPANLLTPRPTPPAATATPRVTQVPNATPPPTSPPRATPSPAVRGTPIAASEPLQGVLLDDWLLSPIIGESFKYRIYLPPDY